MRHALLLRGINVGGKNKVIMSDFKAQLTELGLEEVSSYINSGNFFFKSQKTKTELTASIDTLLQTHYPFVNAYCLLDSRAFQEDRETLPAWWQEEMARKDVLFYTQEEQQKQALDIINRMTLTNELVHFGETAVFWATRDQKDFLKTAYHKQLIKTPLYKAVTIRNAKTYEKIASQLKE